MARNRLEWIGLGMAAGAGVLYTLGGIDALSHNSRGNEYATSIPAYLEYAAGLVGLVINRAGHSENPENIEREN
jgi:hypothetical protein